MKVRRRLGLGALIGFPLALGIAFAPPAFKSPLLLIVILPFWTNLLIRTYAWIAVLRGRGFINGGLAQLYGAPTATVVSMAFLTATLVILPLVFHGIWSFRLDDAEEESPTPATATDSAKPAHA